MEDRKEAFIQRIKNLTPEKRALLSQQLSAVVGDSIAKQSSAQRHQQLVAWVVPEEGKQLSPEALQKFLGAYLPEYMVPAMLQNLEAFPQTPNGKVDRQALVRDLGKQPTQRKYLAPRDSLETVLQSLWVETLEREEIGIHDQFFQLGGHSLLVTVLVAKIRDIFEIQLSLRSVFEAPTIAALAQYMRDQNEEIDVDEAATLILKLAEMSDDEAMAMFDDE